MKRNDPHEECAVRYIVHVANIERQMKGCAEAIELLRAALEGVSAVRYDGVPGGAWRDRKPELLDELAAAIERTRQTVADFEAVRLEAAGIFAGSTDATICWLKHGKRMTWRDVGKEVGYSWRSCIRREHAGLEYIFTRMPREFKQVGKCDT